MENGKWKMENGEWEKLQIIEKYPQLLMESLHIIGWASVL